MRRAMVLFVAVVMLSAIPVVANAHTTVDHFTGIWTAIDEDGSRMTLRITDRGDGTVDMTLRDNGGTFCRVFNRVTGIPTVPLVATGEGTVDGHTLTVPFDIVCRNGITGTGIGVTYTLQNGTMTRPILPGPGEVVWTRRAAF